MPVLAKPIAMRSVSNEGPSLGAKANSMNSTFSTAGGAGMGEVPARLRPRRRAVLSSSQINERRPSSATACADAARNRSLKISSERNPPYPVVSSASMKAGRSRSPCPGMQRQWRAQLR